MINLVSTRVEDKDLGECSGCGRMCRIHYEIQGRWDKEKGHMNERLFLCYRCFGPFRRVIKNG